MQNNFGYDLPKAMHPEFGALVKAECDKLGRELSPQELMEVFRRNYLDIEQKLWLVRHTITNIDHEQATFEGVIHLVKEDRDVTVHGKGNGPIDAFFKALQSIGVKGFEFVNYSEHSISQGSDSRAICYIELKTPAGRSVFGVGISHGIFKASVRGIICAINRSDTPLHFDV